MLRDVNWSFHEAHDSDMKGQALYRGVDSRSSVALTGKRLVTLFRLSNLTGFINGMQYHMSSRASESE